MHGSVHYLFGWKDWGKTQKSLLISQSMQLISNLRYKYKTRVPTVPFISPIKCFQIKWTETITLYTEGLLLITVMIMKMKMAVIRGRNNKPQHISVALLKEPVNHNALSVQNVFRLPKSLFLKYRAVIRIIKIIIILNRLL